MGNLLQDIRYGFRMLVKKPGFTIIAVIALALGIGANTAIFSVVNAVLLRPLPFQNPERLVMVWQSAPQIKASYDVLPAALPNFVDWQRESKSFEQLAAFTSWSWILSGAGEPEQVWGARVSASLFPALGVQAMLGRTFSSEEDREGNERVAVISQSLWQRRFNSDPSIVGKKITLNEQPFVVVGVMPQQFKFPGGMNLLSGLRFSPKTELWIPLAITSAEMKQRGTLNSAVVGLLKQGTTRAQAQAEMQSISEQLGAQYPKTNKGFTVNIIPLHEQVVGDVRPALLILLGTVGLVLLIACANVANLLLALAAARQKEIAIRTAMGAGRWRILRQLLTESILLALCGGAFGLLLAFWGIDALGALIPESIPRAAEIGVDARMLLFTLGVSLLTGLFFGLAPALQVSKTDINVSLKEGTRGTTAGLRHNRLRSLLVISEVALALVLLAGATLLVRSFIRLEKVDPGFDSAHALTAEVSLPFVPPSSYEKPEAQAAFFQRAAQEIRRAPGVVAAGFVSSLPLSGAYESTNFLVEGQPPSNVPGASPQADYNIITSDYFRAMNIPLLKGRDFTDQDTHDSPQVTIISEVMARKYFSSVDNALGKRLTVGFEKTPREIVGIVGNVKQLSLNAEIAPAMYLPEQQSPYPGLSLVVRTANDPSGVGNSVRIAIQNVDKNIPVSNVRTLSEVVASSVAASRFSTMLLTIFAAVALILASVGIYGVMSYTVTQRTHEIGIRIALGAQSADVLKMVVRQGMILTLAGVSIGLVAAFTLARLLSSLLFEVKATDPLTFITVALVLSAVALIAIVIPARRATRVDPMVALRYE